MCYWDNDFDRKFDEAVDEIDRKEREKKSVRLIDANKLKAHYAWWKGGTREMTMDEAKHDFDTIIDLQPTVEPKRGKWIDDEETGDLRCSLCGHYTCEIQGYWGEADEKLAEVFDIPVGTKYHASTTPKYCSRCGALMRDESTMGQVKPIEGVNEK